MMRMKTRATAVPFIILAAIGTSSDVEAAAPPARDGQVQIVAEKMCCKGCAQKVSGQLYAARGVKTVKVDLKKKIVSVFLPQPNAAMLGQLWHAVEQGEGGPTKLVTTEATYTLIPAVPQRGTRQPQQSVLTIVIDNLHCKGCANKIAAQLYALKGVTKVSVDMKKEMMFVQTSPNAKVSPWQVINAVAQADERPLAVIGPHGKLAIKWANQRILNKHQQAQQTSRGGIQR